jgi:tetratricopeptide (TPR) repeat protein
LTREKDYATLLTAFLMPRGSTILAASSSRFFCVVFGVVSLLASAARAQQVDLRENPGALLTLPTYYSTAPGTGVLVFAVYAERNAVHLDRQALLKLVNQANHTAIWQTTQDTSKGVFTNIPYGSYEVEVSAVGYLSAHQELKVVENFGPVQIDMVLHRDPAALNLDVANTMMSPKTRRDTRRAVSALKSGKLQEAQKYLDHAHNVDPGDSNLNFLLGYLYFQKKNFADASTYLNTATRVNPHNAQALTLLGRTGLETRDYPAARSALEQAVLADSENWLPHNLLADAYLHEKSYSKARDEAQIAIAKGRSAASPAQLVLGQALLNLGLTQEGVQALNVFLQESPQHPVVEQVRNLIEEAKSSNLPQPDSTSASSSASEDALQARTPLSGVDPLLALPAAHLSVTSWQPPGVDDVKLSIAPGVVCPSEQVVEESGRRVQALVEDVTRFAAVEDLFHQTLDEYGSPVRTETRKYNYVASISEPQPGYLAVDEYRADKLSLADYPGNIASTGFAALALVFHPHMRDNFEMSCEGLGDWHGQATWLVHFRQRDDRPNRMHSYKMGNQIHPVALKGRAWIGADKFQIVRIEAEMLNPMPEIQLLSEHQVVEYGPIPFPKKNVSLWLPKSAEIYFDFRKHRYYRRHSFDHYMLFSADTEEKRKEPVAKPDNKRDENKSPSGD